jgi:hypothetical protein
MFFIEELQLCSCLYLLDTSHTAQDTETDPVLSAGPGAPPHALLGPGHPRHSPPLTRPRPPLPGLQVSPPPHALLGPEHSRHSPSLTSPRPLLPGLQVGPAHAFLDPSIFTTHLHSLPRVILVRIRIPRSVPLTNRSGSNSSSDSFIQWLSVAFIVRRKNCKNFFS